jgi:S-adenosylmethionine-diacylgycerolhomoserine-N-methlytransferase
MDRMYRHQRHIYDLTRKPYLLGRDPMIARLAPPPGGTVLEIGCGTGRNLVAAAQLHPEARFFGFDVSAAMLATAGDSVERAGLTTRIALAQADATRFDPSASFGRADFDRVFISYVLSMIPDWPAVLRAAAGALAPRGSLHVVDFGQQQQLPATFRWLLRRWLKLFDVTPRISLRAELERVAAAHNLLLDFRELYAGYSVLAVLSRP